MPGAALLDVQLLNGMITPVAERLRSLAVPFVLVSGYTGPELQKPALANAPNVGKPVMKFRLLDALANAVQAAGSRQQYVIGGRTVGLGHSRAERRRLVSPLTRGDRLGAVLGSLAPLAADAAGEARRRPLQPSRQPGPSTTRDRRQWAKRSARDSSRAELQVTIDGREFANIAVAAAEYGIPVRRVRRRLPDGWTPEQAVGLHPKPKTPRASTSYRSTPVEIEGVRYPSITAAVRALGIEGARNKIYQRIYSLGWEPVEAILDAAGLRKADRPRPGPKRRPAG